MLRNETILQPCEITFRHNFSLAKLNNLDSKFVSNYFFYLLNVIEINVQLTQDKGKQVRGTTEEYTVNIV